MRLIPLLLLSISTVLLLPACTSEEGEGEYGPLSMMEEEDLTFVDQTINKTLIRLTREALDLQKVRPDSLKDIRPIESEDVVPVVYQTYLPVQYLEPELRQQQFIAQVLPHILIAKYGMDRERRMLEEIRNIADGESDEAEAARLFIRKQIAKYEANSYEDLREKFVTHPISIVLAQTIVETDWGVARFFEEGHNLFGLESTDPTAPKVESLTATEGETIFFRKYIRFLPESVTDYFKLISTDDRFVVFREKRTQTKNPLELIEYLDEFHPDIGATYVDKLKEVIIQYDLEQYDNYQIDPDFINQLKDRELNAIIKEATTRKKKIVDTNSKQLRKIAQETLKIQRKTIETVDEIVPLKGNRVVPHVYENVVTLKYLPVAQKKQKFMDLMVPSILVTNHAISQARIKVDNIQQKWSDGDATSAEDSSFVQKLIDDWKADDITHLQDKLITRPISVVLAQAALETGWGSSRFFIKANNVFGVWSFDPNESRLAAGEARENMQVYVKRYPNISASIYDYFKTIARGPYKSYREKRLETSDPFVLVEYLLRYSEMGQHYVNSLKIVMRKANLTKYEDYRLDPAYIEYSYEEAQEPEPAS